MITTTIVIRGAAEVQRNLKDVSRALSGPEMERGVQQACLLVTRSARMLAPVDTGRLRASIIPEVASHGNVVRGVVGSNVAYAPHMELGTGTFVGKPPHHPPGWALDVWARRHGFPNGYVVARIIGRRGGLRPRKFLEDAFVQNADRVYQLTGNAVARIVAR